MTLAKTDEKLEKLNEKVDALTKIVIGDRGQLKAVVWVFGACSVLASIASMARLFNWI